MNDKVLNELFGSGAKVRLIKLFLYNPDESFSISDAAGRARLSRADTRRWLNKLAALGLIKIKKTSHAQTKNSAKSRQQKKKNRR